MRLPRIGVFDSGVGGLTVLKALAERLPAHYFYFGDTARLPYGTKSAETVARYAIGATRFLESQNIDLLVIACNTASALALPQIKEAASVPVVGVVEPGAAMAAQVSQKPAGGRHRHRSHCFQPRLSRCLAAARGRGVRKSLSAVRAAGGRGMDRASGDRAGGDGFIWTRRWRGSDGADVLVLACTHYPLIAPLLRQNRSGADDDCGFGGIDGVSGEEDGGEYELPPFPNRAGKDGAPALLRSSAYRSPFVSVLRDRFGGEVQEAGDAVSGAAGRSRGARGFGRVRDDFTTEAQRTRRIFSLVILSEAKNLLSLAQRRLQRIAKIVACLGTAQRPVQNAPCRKAGSSLRSE